MTNLVKLSTIPSSNILELQEHLEKFNSDKASTSFLISHIGNFFTNLTFLQELGLTEILQTKNEEQLTEFIKQNPNILVDLSGTTVAKRTDTWQVKEYALMTRCMLIKNKPNLSDLDKHFMDAYSLDVIKDIKPFTMEYLKLKLLYRDSSFTTNLTKNSCLSNVIDYQLFMRKVLTYYFNNISDPNIDYFLKYVFYFLDIVRSDIHKISDLGNYYIHRINELIN